MSRLFWGSVFAVLYTYFGYPLVLLIISRYESHSTSLTQGEHTPSVTLIITAHNEAARIEKKLQNTLELEYPPERMEIIVASDASTDGTDETVQQYAHRGIRLVRSPRRAGKEFAQKCAIQEARGDVIVFSDVATILDRHAIRTIVSNFSDPTVGCVSSEDRFIDEAGNVSGEGTYVRYEMWLRSLESKVHSLVGLSGSFFAARRLLCLDWPADIPSDFNTLLNAIRHGYRGVNDPKSIGTYTNIKDETREFQRKVRTITRGISALMHDPSLMNPLRYGIFSWQIISHKLMRWLVPLFLVVTLVMNVILALQRRWYVLILSVQAAFYGLALSGSRHADRSLLLKIPYYFLQVNRAIAVAWLKYLKGERYVTWTPSAR